MIALFCYLAKHEEKSGTFVNFYCKLKLSLYNYIFLCFYVDFTEHLRLYEKYADHLCKLIFLKASYAFLKCSYIIAYTVLFYFVFISDFKKCFC